MSLIKCSDKLLFYVITGMTKKKVRPIFRSLHRRKKYKSFTKSPGRPTLKVTSPWKTLSVTPRKTPSSLSGTPNRSAKRLLTPHSSHKKGQKENEIFCITVYEIEN